MWGGLSAGTQSTCHLEGEKEGGVRALTPPYVFMCTQKTHPRTPLCTPARNTEAHADAANLSGLSTFKRGERRGEKRRAVAIRRLLRCRPVAASCGFPCLTARRGHQSVTAQRRRRFFRPPILLLRVRPRSEFTAASSHQPATAPFMCARARLSVCVRLQPCCQRVTAPKKKNNRQV